MKIVKAVLIAASLLLSPYATAGIYSDDLARCLVEKSSSNDKITLVRWMFSAMSLHPAVTTIAPVAADKRDANDKAMAELIVNLLSETCLDQSKKAIQYEGAIAIQSSFEVLGKVAAQELFSNPDVAQGLSNLQQHVDTDKLQQSLGSIGNQ